MSRSEQLWLSKLFRIVTYRVVRNDRPRERACFQAIHALQPSSPLLGVHPGEDDGRLLLRVAPLAGEVRHGLCDRNLVIPGRSSNDDKRLVWRVHDILEVVRVELQCTRQAVVEELGRAIESGM